MKNLFGDDVLVRDGKAQILGCSVCPLDKAPNTKKIKGLVRITGRRAMVWAQSPGRQENEQGLELVGPSGKFLWETLAIHGLTRDDFDVQNVVRCRPVDRQTGKDRNPTEEEILCCSVYNDRAIHLNQGKAQVHLILGEIAGAQLLGREYRKDSACIWYEPWGAYVIVAAHPAAILRSGGKDAGNKYIDFVDRLKGVRVALDYPGRYGYQQAQDYGAINTEKEALDFEKLIRSEAKAGRYVSADVEDGTVDGEKKLLVVGLGWGHYTGKTWDTWQGGARSFVLHHPDADRTKHRIDAVERVLGRIIADKSIPKVMQNGPYDRQAFLKHLKVRIAGYDWDTYYGMFMRMSWLKAFGLAAQVRWFFQEFQDYKGVPSGTKNYADIPLAKLVVYNCSDCDVTKRSFEKLKDSDWINPELMRIYTQCGTTLHIMEGRGPLLDSDQLARLEKAVPEMLEPIERALKRLAGKDDFNPAAPAQIAWLLYKKLKLPRSEDERDGESTKGGVLDVLARRVTHPAPKLVLQYRALSIVRNTFLMGLRRSYEMHAGEAHTRWNMTGTVAGRLSSGSGRKAEETGLVNLQNIHGNAHIKNCFVSDRNWREAL